MTDLTVAQTILAQLGGSRFKAMTGANSFTGSADTLSFRVPKAAKGIKAVIVKLLPSDTYEVRFLGQRRAPTFEVFDVAKHDDVYCDQLQAVFTAETGLDTHL